MSKLSTDHEQRVAQLVELTRLMFQNEDCLGDVRVGGVLYTAWRCSDCCATILDAPHLGRGRVAHAEWHAKR